MAGKSFKKKVEPATTRAEIKNISTWRAGKQMKMSGRPPKFASPEALMEECQKYFTFCDENPIIEIDYKGKDAERVELYRPRAYTITGMMVYLGLSSRYLAQMEAEWKEYVSRDDKDLTPAQIEKKHNAQGFLTMLARIKDIIYTQKFEFAAVNMMNTYMISRELGIRSDEELKKNDEERDGDNSNQFANIVVDEANTKL